MYQLHATVVEAKDLPTFDTTNIYAILTIGKNTEHQETNKNQSSNPNWDQKFDFELENIADSNLKVKLLNYDGTIDEKIGNVIIPLTSIQDSMQEVNQWYEIKDKQDNVKGTIHLKLTITQGHDEYQFQNSIAPTKYLISFTVISAEDIENLRESKEEDCTPDFYVVLQMKDRNRIERTCCKIANFHPVWNQTFQYHIEAKNLTIFNIKLKNHIIREDKDTIVAEKDFDFKNIPDDTIDYDSWIELQSTTFKNEKCRLHVKIHFEPTDDFSDDEENDSNLQIVFDKNNLFPEKVDLRVTVIGARDLPKVDQISGADPYCVVELNKITKQTKTIFKSMSPEWIESFDFSIQNRSEANLVLTVIDANKVFADKYMSKIEIPVSSFKESTDQWYDLQPFRKIKKGGRIHILVKTTDPNKNDSLVNESIKNKSVIDINNTSTPENPNKPVASEDPNKPLTPKDPNKPLASEDPNKPLTPKNPNKSVTSEEEESVASEDPNKPLTPKDPSKPLASEDPNKPLASEDQNKPLTPKDPSKPLASEDPNKPLASEDPNKPLASEDPSKPLTPKDPNKSVTSEEESVASKDPSKPLASEDPNKPLASEDQNKPLTPKDPNKPLASEDPNKPLASEDPNKPLASEDQNKPLTPKNPSKPVASEDPNKPLTPKNPNKSVTSEEEESVASKDPNKPLASEDQNKPLTPKDPNKPLASEDPNKPLASEDQNKPLASKDPNKPLASEDPNKPLASEDPNKPLASEDPNKPLASEDPNKPLASEDQNKPLTPKNPSKPVASEDPNKPLTPKNPNKSVTSEEEESVASEDPNKPLTPKNPNKSVTSEEEESVASEDPNKPLTPKNPNKSVTSEEESVSSEKIDTISQDEDDKFMSSNSLRSQKSHKSRGPRTREERNDDTMKSYIGFNKRKEIEASSTISRSQYSPSQTLERYELIEEEEEVGDFSDDQFSQHMSERQRSEYELKQIQLREEEEFQSEIEERRNEIKQIVEYDALRIYRENVLIPVQQQDDRLFKNNKNLDELKGRQNKPENMSQMKLEREIANLTDEISTIDEEIEQLRREIADLE